MTKVKRRPSYWVLEVFVTAAELLVLWRYGPLAWLLAFIVEILTYMQALDRGGDIALEVYNGRP